MNGKSWLSSPCHDDVITVTQDLEIHCRYPGCGNWWYASGEPAITNKK